MAHPGAMIGSALKTEPFPDDVLDVFDQAARLSAQAGIAWEINRLLGRKLPTDEHRQRYWMIPDIARRRGVKLVYGSDAHQIGHIAATDFAGDVLQTLGGPAVLTDPTTLARNRQSDKDLKPRINTNKKKK